MIKKTLNQNAKYAHELLKAIEPDFVFSDTCLLYTSPSPRDS